MQKSVQSTAFFILHSSFFILNFTSTAWQATFGAGVLEEALSQRLPHLWELRRAYSSCVIAIGGIVAMRVRTVKPLRRGLSSALRLRRIST
jgi:hypothetical protein